MRHLFPSLHFGAVQRLEIRNAKGETVENLNASQKMSALLWLSKPGIVSPEIQKIYSIVLPKTVATLIERNRGEFEVKRAWDIYTSAVNTGKKPESVHILFTDEAEYHETDASSASAQEPVNKTGRQIQAFCTRLYRDYLDTIQTSKPLILQQTDDVVTMIQGVLYKFIFSREKSATKNAFRKEFLAPELLISPKASSQAEDPSD